MAITEANLTTNSSATDATSYNTASISPTASRLILIGIVNTASGGATPTGIAGAGLTFTEITNVKDTTNGVGLSLWRALEASPSTGALTISFGVTALSCGWSVFEFAGIDTSGTNGSGAIVQSATNSSLTGAASSLTTTLAAFGSASNGAASVHGWANISGTAATATADTGWSEIHDTGYLDGTAAVSIQSQWRASNDTTAAVTWSATGLLLSIAVELKAAAGAVLRKNSLMRLGVGR